jgi:hypothetical protein
MLEEATTRFAPVLEKVTPQNKTKQNKSFIPGAFCVLS